MKKGSIKQKSVVLIFFPYFIALKRINTIWNNVYRIPEAPRWTSTVCKVLVGDALRWSQLRPLRPHHYILNRKVWKHSCQKQAWDQGAIHQVFPVFLFQREKWRGKGEKVTVSATHCTPQINLRLPRARRTPSWKKEWNSKQRGPCSLLPLLQGLVLIT